MRLLIWHVHAAWDTAFVRGGHEYLIPTVPDRGPDGRGLPRTYPWPGSAREVAPERLRGEHVDAVVLQRPEELELARDWLGRKPGPDVPAIYVEHNTPRGEVPDTRHVLADRDDIPVVHVTHFNELMWDTGRAPTRVIEHAVVDPGYRYCGDLPHAGVVVNEPIRRWRVTGTDLLPRLAEAAPLEVFGMKVTGLGDRLGLDPGVLRVHEDPPQPAMHRQLARCRVYAHPVRWTSLGLSLIEAMLLGMPVVALATTEVVEAVPPGAGVVTNRLDALVRAIRRYVDDPDEARRAGREGRAAASARYALPRFLRDFDRLLEEVIR